MNNQETRERRVEKAAPIQRRGAKRRTPMRRGRRCRSVPSGISVRWSGVLASLVDCRHGRFEFAELLNVRLCSLIAAFFYNTFFRTCTAGRALSTGLRPVSEITDPRSLPHPGRNQRKCLISRICGREISNDQTCSGRDAALRRPRTAQQSIPTSIQRKWLISRIWGQRSACGYVRGTASQEGMAGIPFQLLAFTVEPFGSRKWLISRICEVIRRRRRTIADGRPAITHPEVSESAANDPRRNRRKSLISRISEQNCGEKGFELGRICLVLWPSSSPRQVL